MKTLTNDQLISNNTDDYDDNDDDDERRSPLYQENKINKKTKKKQNMSELLCLLLSCLFKAQLFISCALNFLMLRFAGLFWSNL